jgi:DNA-3-methyladenine glycosylase I
MANTRCTWCGDDPLYVAYHDDEWGVPCHDDNQLFELLCLEGAQAGLSWITVLRKRETYREAFDGFDANKMAKYNARKNATLMKNAGIVRNRLKVEGFRKNAIAYLTVQKELGSFDKYIWQFVGDKPKAGRIRGMSDAVATTPEAEEMSRALKKRGFTFVGPTICYAFMQASGMVNDHFVSCFRYKQLVGR